MPFYEYKCEACGHEMEKLVRMNTPPPECPKCKDTTMKKKVSKTGFKLEGGGWAKDGYS